MPTAPRQASNGPTIGAAADPPSSTLALLAVLTAVGLELIRSSGPLLTLAFEVGVIVAAGTAIAAYASAGVFVLVLRSVAPGRDTTGALVVGVVVLAVARLVVQGLEAWVRFAVGLATVGLVIAVLTLGVDAVAGHRRGGGAAAAAVAWGAAAGIGIQLGLGTWDAYWRHGPLGWGATGVVLAVMVACAHLARRNPPTAPAPPSRRAWALGPALAVMVMLAANPAFASAQSGVRLVVAGPIAAVGMLLAGALAPLAAHHRAGSSRPFRTTMTALLVVLAIAVAGVFGVRGPAVLGLLVIAQLGLVVALARVLGPTGSSGDGAPPSALGAAGRVATIGLGAILPLLIFQLDYDLPLGFPNELVIVGAAALLTAAALPTAVVPTAVAVPTTAAAQATATSTPAAPRGRRVGSSVDPGTGRGSARRPGWRPLAPLLVVSGAAVLAGTTVALLRAAATGPPTAAPPAGPITLVSWNLHFGVDPDGDVDLERIARSIEQQGPSVVTLQEVSRGWVMAGGTDLATWLAERLEMRMVFSPGADRQFGNAILTDLRLEDVTRLALPYGQGPQNRSAISADVVVAAGSVRVTSVHLQNKDTTPTRLTQIETLLAAEGDTAHAIVAGDFNAEPGSPEIELMVAGGLVSAQDAAGDPTAMTSPSTDPRRRIDWVFGRGVSFGDVRVLDEARSSDHLPLVATFTIESGDAG
jgi:endonuclease/exonuclease/phosphatase family metal-dependent hydrolase